jgi:hypothetical protein
LDHSVHTFLLLFAVEHWILLTYRSEDFEVSDKYLHYY